MEVNEKENKTSPIVLRAESNILNTLNVLKPKIEDLYKINYSSEALSDTINKYVESMKPSIEMIINEMKYKQESMLKYLQPSIKEVINQIEYQQKLILKSIQPLIETIKFQIPNYSPYFKELAESLKLAKEDPDSLINWYEYSNKLSDYLWTIPFDIESNHLKEIFESIDSEEQFDEYMINYFNKDKIKKLFIAIEKNLPVKHKTIFNQVKFAFYNRKYALSIVGIMSIIDELCSFYLIDKGCSSRLNLFKPIIQDLNEKGIDNFIVLDVMIVSNNINTIYEKVDFNSEIKITTHKKARRNPSQHGRSFSNRKIDVLMLLNTMYYLLILKNELAYYTRKLHFNRNKKLFYIPNKEERIKIKKAIKNNINKNKKLEI